MGWFDKKDEDYTQFLENPKERYDAFNKEAGELMERNKMLKDSFDAKEQEYSDLEQNYADETLRLSNQVAQAEKEARDAENKFEGLIEQEKLRLQTFSDMKLAEKSAKLEENYNHEVHTFIETQNAENKEMIPIIIKETIQAFRAEAS